MPSARRPPVTAVAAVVGALLLVVSAFAVASGCPGDGIGSYRQVTERPGPALATASADPVGGLSVLATVAVGASPELATWNASQGQGGGDVYVANAGSGNVSILDATTLVGTVNVSAAGVGPFEPIDNPANASVLLTYHTYVTPHGLSAIHGPLVHGTQAVSAVAGITDNDEPVLGAYDVSNASVYVTDDGVTVGVAVIGAANQTRFATVPTGADPHSLAVDPGNGEVYVACPGSDSVSVVSGVAAIAAVPVPAIVDPAYAVLNDSHGTFAPDYAADIAYDPANGDIYLADAGAGSVSVFNKTTVIANVSVGAFPYALAYDPSDGDVYVTDVVSGAVSVLHGTSVVATVRVGHDPIAATYDAADGDMLIANLNSSNVSVLNGTTVVGSIAVGSDPVAVVFDTVNHHAYVVNQGSGTVTILEGPPGGGGSGIPAWGWGLIGLVVILVVVGLAAVLSRRRKRGQAAEVGSPRGRASAPNSPPVSPPAPPPPPGAT